MTNDELSPSFSGDVQLEDLETLEQLNVSMSSRVMEAYEHERKQHQEGLELLCRKFGSKFIAGKCRRWHFACIISSTITSKLGAVR